VALPSAHVTSPDLTPTPADLGRIAVAEQLRRGIHLLHAKEVDPAALHDLAGQLGQHFDMLESLEPRERDHSRFTAPTDMPCPDDGEEFYNSPMRPISGRGTAWSIPLHVVRDGDDAVTNVTLGPAHEGAPGRSHGGFVAAIYDDLLGFLLMLHGGIAFTAYLTVNYVAATPIGEPVEFRVRIDRVEGKKLFLVGECRAGDELLTTCEALFIDAAEAFAAMAQADNG